MLVENNIGIEGAKTFAEALKINPSITDLNLECNKKITVHYLLLKLLLQGTKLETKEQKHLVTHSKQIHHLLNLTLMATTIVIFFLNTILLFYYYFIATQIIELESKEQKVLLTHSR